MPIITKEIPLSKNQGLSVSLTYLGDTLVPDITSLRYEDGTLIGDVTIDRVVSVTNFSGQPVTAPDGLEYEVGKWDMGKEGGIPIVIPLSGGDTLVGDPECLIHVVGYIEPFSDSVIQDVVQDGDNLVNDGIKIVNTLL